MRALAIVAAVVVSAAAAQGKEVEWVGTWAKDGGGSIEVKLEGDRCALTTGVPVDGTERSVAFAGPGRGEQLALEGKVSRTRGAIGALGGSKEAGDGRPCTLMARSRTEGDFVVARVRYSLDGRGVLEETWRRKAPVIEILELRVDGAKLEGAFDAKLARTGLEVRYAFRGEKPAVIEALVVLDHEREKYPGFYPRERVALESLGLVTPGEHTFKWDGRDATEAKRILVEGGYEVVLHVGSLQREAREKVSVAAPRFVFAGWKWGKDDVLPAVGSYEPALTSTMSDHGYATAPYLAPKDRADVLRRIEKAAFVVLSSHGRPGEIYVYDGDPAQARDDAKATPIRTLDLQGADLRDLHVAIVSGCSAAKANGSDPGVVQTLCDRGCDLAIGFANEVFVKQAIGFQRSTLALLERGAPIEKAARDGARAALREALGGATDEELDAYIAQEKKSATVTSAAAALTVKRSKTGNRAEDETFWPPRYGNSKN